MFWSNVWGLRKTGGGRAAKFGAQVEHAVSQPLFCAESCAILRKAVFILTEYYVCVRMCTTKLPTLAAELLWL
jgi:hypothetical protein